MLQLKKKNNRTMPNDKSDWIKDLMTEVRRHVQTDRYRLSKHVMERLGQRSLELSDLMFVLLNGVHEQKLTQFDTKKQAWKYAIKGKTTEGVELRAVVSFDGHMIVITVIRLVKVRRRNEK